jgi:cell division septum initiation protein DivIVA
MAKPQIDNYEDLMEEKERLKARLRSRKTRIKQSFEEIKDEINPFTNIRKTAQEAFSTSTTNPLVKFGIKRASELLIGKVLLKKAGWLPRLVVPFLVREVATRLIGSKADKKIATALKSAASKIRETDIPDLSGKKTAAQL